MTVAVCVAAWVVGALAGERAYLDGDAALRSGLPADAVPLFLHAAEIDRALAHYAEVRVADALAAQGDAPGARAALDNVIANAPYGPWTRMAHARLAKLAEAAGNVAAAARHYRAVFDAPIIPWSVQKMQWDAAGVMAQDADAESRAVAAAIYRTVIDKSILPDERLRAARALVAFPGAEDRMWAVQGLLRSGGVPEAALALASFGTALTDPAGTLLTATHLAAWRIDTPEAEQHLDTFFDANQGNPWLRFWIGYTVRTQAEKLGNLAAAPWARALARRLPEALEAGDSLWWLADRLAKQDEPEAAAALFLQLAEACRAHFRSDDAWLRAAALRAAMKDAAGAVAAYEALAAQQPNSVLVPEAHYRAARLLDAAGKRAESAEQLALAAEGGVGSWWAYRARDLLPAAAASEAEREPARALRIDGVNTVLRPTPAPDAPVKTQPPQVANDERVLRLRFFGAHGLDEGEWEAMHLCRALEKVERPGPWYRAVAEAGYAHTAERYADLFGWGRAEGAMSLERRRLSYPLAYWPQFKEQAAAQGLDPFLLMAIARQESTFRATIASRAGARGVMQVMPGTAKWMADTDPDIEPAHVAHLESAKNSIRLGANYLEQMVSKYAGNLIHALAAYNAGPGNLNKWRKSFGGLEVDRFIDAIPFTETRDYVRKVLGNYLAYHSLYPPPAGLP